MSKTHRFTVEVEATKTRKGRAPHMVTHAHSAKKGTYNRAAIKRDLVNRLESEAAEDLAEFESAVAHLADQYEEWDF
jgi:hypothetical protein